MKTIPADELDTHPEHYDTIVNILEKGGLVIVPCGSAYRILTSFRDVKAVTRLMQSKRRTGKAPSLVFVPHRNRLSEITDEVNPIAQSMARDCWPGALTILFTPSQDIPKKILKQVAKANGHIGVRIPRDTIARTILERFGEPILVSSANKEKRGGASSPAQVRKNFARSVDLFIDAGDLPPAPSSTVVRIDNGEIHITRQGDIPADRLNAYA